MDRSTLFLMFGLLACTPSSDNVGDVDDTSTTNATTTGSTDDSTTASSMSSTTAAETTTAATTSNTTVATSDGSTGADGSTSSGGSDTGARACEAIIGSMDCEALAEVSPDLTLEDCQMCQGIACGTVQMCDSQYPCIDDTITLVGCCEDRDCEGLSNFCGMFIGTNNICVLDDDM